MQMKIKAIEALLTSAAAGFVPEDQAQYFDSVTIPGDRGQEKLRQALSTGEMRIEEAHYQTLMGFKEE